MSVATLLKESTHETIIPVRWPALAGGASTGNAILALDLGQKTGWAVRNTDGAIASGTVEFKPGRFEGGGMVYLRFRAWLQEVDETAGGWWWYAAGVGHQDQEILLDDEPRFTGGAEISLAYAHLSLVFDKALRAYSLTCDDEDGEAVRLILEPSELEQIAREFLAAREWSRRAGVVLAPLALCEGPMEQTRRAA